MIFVHVLPKLYEAYIPSSTVRFRIPGYRSCTSWARRPGCPGSRGTSGVLDERIHGVGVLMGAVGDPERGPAEDFGRRQLEHAGPPPSTKTIRVPGGLVQAVLRCLEAVGRLAVHRAAGDRASRWPRVHGLAGPPADGGDHRPLRPLVVVVGLTTTSVTSLAKKHRWFEVVCPCSWGSSPWGGREVLVLERDAAVGGAEQALAGGRIDRLAGGSAWETSDLEAEDQVRDAAGRCQLGRRCRVIDAGPAIPLPPNELSPVPTMIR